jgi:carbonic anhydrase/acetyltransferase-like protein (isoleucine patch superfamily)
LLEPFFGALDGHRPRMAEDAFVAPGVVVVGRVRIGARSSVWYGSVLRGDDEEILVGEDTNVQDLSLMHADPGFPAVLGNRVTVGHRAIVHGATVEDDVLVGMGAILLNGARIGSGSVVAAGAVVTSGTEVPENSLVAGLPGKVLREVRHSDREMIQNAFESYVRKSGVHRGAEPLSPREVGFS